MNFDALKQDSLELARQQSLVVERGGCRLGYLVPVGPWILRAPGLVAEISKWRARAMKMFLTQFESTPLKTKEYLASQSVAVSNRILFLIEAEGVFVGHIGLSNATTETAEVDNLMRGVAGGSTDLIEVSERTLIGWSFSVLGLKSLSLRLISYNFMAREIHASLGFVTSQRLPLNRVVFPDRTVLEPCDTKDSNVPYCCDIMTLDRSDFESRSHYPS